MSSATSPITAGYQVAVYPGELCCPRCGSPAIRRQRRKTVWQKTAMPVLRKFPWHCLQCRGNFVARHRHLRRI